MGYLDQLKSGNSFNLKEQPERKEDISIPLPSSELLVEETVCYELNEFTKKLLSRLQAGGRWLTAQQEAWVEGRKEAVDDEQFSQALVMWDGLEQTLRTSCKYSGCIFGPSEFCPEDAVVTCKTCVGARDVIRLEGEL